MVIGCAVALAAPAGAAGADGLVVAQDGGLTLRAQHDNHRLCVSLNQLFPLCTRAPASPFDGVFADSSGSHAIGVALAPDVAEVTVQSTRGESAPHWTVAAPGFKARFALIPHGGVAQFLRTYDADGNLIGSVQDLFGGDPPRTDRRSLSRRLAVSRQLSLNPDPVDVDRSASSTCITVRRPGGDPSVCQPDAVHARLFLQAQDACAPRRPLVIGSAGQAVRSVAVRLTTGRRIVAPTHVLPPLFGPRRAVAIAIPPGTGVRNAGGFDAHGHRIARQILHAAPSGFPCPAGAGGSSELYGFATGRHGAPLPAVAVATAGPHQLLVADRGRQLCVRIDATRRSCELPPVSVAHGFVLRREGPVIGALVPAYVTEVDLRLDDGTVQRVRSHSGPAYTGRYAGLTRFVLANVHGHRGVGRVVARNASGARVGRGFVFDRPVRTPRRRLAGTPFRIFRRHSGPDHPRTEVCAVPHPNTSPFGSPICGGRRETQVLSAVTCAPRRALLYGLLGRKARRVTVRLSGGTPLRATVRRLRGARLWYAIPPRRATVRSVVVAGAREPVAVHLPPAAEQCGYGTFDFAF
ncbi:MAG: hypothetical protein QOF76_3997 [Solirubrobacteraceae bacterium]|nr:hypothetical protein [Solirubrobacteraceae bacterium]